MLIVESGKSLAQNECDKAKTREEISLVFHSIDAYQRLVWGQFVADTWAIAYQGWVERNNLMVIRVDKRDFLDQAWRSTPTADGSDWPLFSKVDLQTLLKGDASLLEKGRAHTVG